MARHVGAVHGERSRAEDVTQNEKRNQNLKRGYPDKRTLARARSPRGASMRLLREKGDCRKPLSIYPLVMIWPLWWAADSLSPATAQDQPGRTPAQGASLNCDAGSHRRVPAIHTPAGDGLFAAGLPSRAIIIPWYKSADARALWPHLGVGVQCTLSYHDTLLDHTS